MNDIDSNLDKQNIDPPQVPAPISLEDDEPGGFDNNAFSDVEKENDARNSGSSKSNSKLSNSSNKSKSYKLPRGSIKSSNKSRTSKRGSRSTELSLQLTEEDAVKKMIEAVSAAEISLMQVKIKAAEAMEKLNSTKGIERKENEDVSKDVTIIGDGSKWVANADAQDNILQKTVSESQPQDVMMDINQLQSQPNIYLDVFSGNASEYQYFKAKLQHVAKRAGENQRVRLTILINHTHGEARELIKHLLYEDREDCYTKAMDILDNEYGSQHLRVDVENDETQAPNVHIEEEATVCEYRRQLYKEFKNNITLHGYRQLSTEKGWRKVFWIFLMTLLIGFAVYLSYHMLRDFGYRTALEYEYEEGLSHLDMPTITICGNMPVYSPKSFKKFPLKITLKEYKTFYKEMFLRDWKTPSNASKAILQGLYAINITSYKEILKLFENTIEDTMNLFPPGGQLKTTYRETLTMSPLIFGNSLCHQWNYYDVKKVSKQQKMGNRLLMFLDVHANYQLVEFRNFKIARNIEIYVHPYGTPHYLTKHTELINLQTGKQTTINIELTERNLLPSPYSTKCGTKEMSIIRNFPYSRALCEVDCILTKIYEKCKCVGFEYEGYIDDVPICSVEQMKCYRNHRGTYNSLCANYSSKCPRECTYHQYHIHSSVVDIADYSLYTLLLYLRRNRTMGFDETDENYFKENILGFDIGYKSLSKKVENYVPLVTPSGLIGTLGGSIGLCLGFSFVTAFEVIVLIYDYVTARWKVKAKMKNV